MYRKKAHIHFIGIGGIGMSGIATILKYQGYIISGCDSDQDQQSIKNLKNIGCTIQQGNNVHACKDTSIDIVVYSSAIKPDNPEIIAAQRRDIPTIPRALMLAELMRMKHSVAIAGSHGKTTTTSLISHILIEAKFDPTVIIGGHLKTISNNARIGSSDFLIAEADESDRSFLHLYASLAVVTNIDLEHLETYKDLDDVKQTFKQFLSNLPFYGKAIVCIDDKNIRSILPIKHIKTIKYGLSELAEIRATDVILNVDHSIFTLWKKKEKLGSIALSMPGQHNVLNALAAIGIVLDLGVDFKIVCQALKSFKGIERRFSFKGTFKGAEIFDDYGHHPKEVLATLAVAKKRAQGKLITIFQPHRFTRTQRLWDEFVETFATSGIDHLIITDIYPASESPIEGVSSQKLVQAIKTQNPSINVHYSPYQNTFTDLQAQLNKVLAPNDLLLLLGAGKINKLADFLI